MKKIFILSLAALALLSACKKDSLTDSTNSFTATIEQSAAKTTLDANRNVNWEQATDKININGVEFTCQNVDGTNHTQATFTSSSSVDANLNSPLYVAYYPASYYYDNAMHLPAIQNYDATTNGISNLPMYAQSDNHNLVFKNLCGVLAITVSSSDFSEVRSITVTADKRLNGAFEVQNGSTTPTIHFTGGTASDAEKMVTLFMETVVDITSGNKTFYIAIPDETYSSLKIDVIGKSSTSIIAKRMQTNSSSIRVERNKIYQIPFNGTKITNGAALAISASGLTTRNWVQLWNGGPLFATINLGETTMAGNTKKYGWSESASSNDSATMVWGSVWKVPTQAEMNELLLAASTTSSTKVSCDFISNGGVYGFSFKGRETDYTTNSLFLPDQQGTAAGGAGYYWSGTSASSDNGYSMNLWYDGSMRSSWQTYSKSYGQLILPILK